MRTGRRVGVRPGGRGNDPSITRADLVLLDCRSSPAGARPTRLGPPPFAGRDSGPPPAAAEAAAAGRPEAPRPGGSGYRRPVRLRDLGPLVIERDGRDLPVAGTKGSAMLALLAIHANRLVSMDALTEAAWGQDAPASAASTLPSHIWRLRQLLEPQRAGGVAPQVLLNDAGGYRLVGSPRSIDSLLLAEATVRVRELLTAGRPDAALREADEALALWRGRPYGRAADTEWAAPAVARLEEMRQQIQERRITALVGLGALDIALSDLRPLIAALPYHETLRALQMEALHRSGRTEQALEAFQEARRTFVDEVGIEPGRDLQMLHRRILDDDLGPARSAVPVPVTVAGPAPDPARPSFREVSGATVGVPARPSVSVQLPASLTPLVGRENEMDRLPRLVAAHRLVTITGSAGCGKTRLAVEVARASAPAFPDGVWFVDLVGLDDPALIVDVVASTIGFVPSADATPVENLRGYLASRRVLLVLDNCEHLLSAAAAMVRAVLHDPDGPGSGILATSRQRLGVPGEVGWTLEPLALPASDADPADAAAVQLLVQRLRAADPSLVVDARNMEAVVRICTAVDGLPLPLELAAARAPAFSLTEIADQVSADPNRLSRPGRTGRDHRATLHSAIDWSYRLLGDAEKVAHGRLSVLPGPFTEAAAAAVLDTDTGETEDLLAELVHRSLLGRVGPARPGRPTTFRQLVTVRAHASRVLGDRSDAAGRRGAVDEAGIRRDAFVDALVARRPPLGTTGEPSWYDALDDDLAAVRATLTRRLIDRSAGGGEPLAAPLAFYWFFRGRLLEATRWLTLEHDLLLDGNSRHLDISRLALAGILTLQGRHQQARPYIDAALPIRPDAGPGRVDAVIETLIGLAGAAWVTDDYPVLIEMHRHLQDLVKDTHPTHLRLLVEAVGVMAQAVSGRSEIVVARAEDVRERAAAAGVPMAIWMVSGPPLAVALFAGRPDLGIPWIERSMANHFPFGTGAGGAFIETRANFAAQQGDFALAARLYGAAQSITRRVGMRWPWRPVSLELLDRARGGLPDTAFDRYWRAGSSLDPLGVLDGLQHGWGQ